ncbi:MULTISPECIES: ribosome biogenesis GTP-binding protein YihA/YsxC [Pseudoalteromonas]|uniref:Probable GTP-binding protein EngB n=1 Tax=Pseudoalteromonas rubra TaxID=43658 RepID=A0A0L0EM38_9GAMM|nr:MULTISPECIES: ribosome biogenesis GTP-binding protein YihA/YsxC [Pseudoalteromonas]MCG7562629.1 ribosome biogenesis GTP-binding protein YihA/YsxC [Pseudoalteromonas sp. McH1-42]KNC65527.1 GTP-binding protein [Pseudoalteromonas rubra]MDK1312446.1 ribosome biogenesis GTP-binding protein YihA/YsxC [Pseudoalteromonas sp. R96]MEC4089818.1 ribosome biogenesis GTP-binding protein YihA/YsxC [Pseudoalteromonas rubra]QPB84746.1 YihA family ribosome biogenesis GTP-binding protein [Pseudoalteromonas ru
MLKSRMPYNRAQFVTSAPDISRLPADTGIEVAFAGRSNAGKSSALNALTDQKLARTSKTPGRTQLINTFSLDEDKRLIDLPGYGFAKVPLEMKKKWQKSLGEYLQKRQSLKGIVVLMDIRHPLKDLDMDLINWAAGSDIPVLALLTKADKLKQGKRKAEVLQVRKALAELNADITVHAFSSLKGLGLKELAWQLDDWFLGPYVKEDAEQDTPSA